MSGACGHHCLASSKVAVSWNIYAGWLRHRRGSITGRICDRKWNLGRRLVTRRRLFRTLLVAGVAIAMLISLRSTFNAADWSGRPDLDQLRRANGQLELPADADGEPLRVFDKVSSVGASRNVVTRQSVIDVDRHFTDVAIRHGWKVSSRRAKKGEVRTVYCAGDVAQIVSLRQRGDMTAIFAGTFWHSNTSSDRYCRLRRQG